MKNFLRNTLKKVKEKKVTRDSELDFKNQLNNYSKSSGLVDLSYSSYQGATRLVYGWDPGYHPKLIRGKRFAECPALIIRDKENKKIAMIHISPSGLNSRSSMNSVKGYDYDLKGQRNFLQVVYSALNELDSKKRGVVYLNELPSKPLDISKIQERINKGNLEVEIIGGNQLVVGEVFTTLSNPINNKSHYTFSKNLSGNLPVFDVTSYNFGEGIKDVYIDPDNTTVLHSDGKFYKKGLNFPDPSMFSKGGKISLNKSEKLEKIVKTFSFLLFIFGIYNLSFSITANTILNYTIKESNFYGVLFILFSVIIFLFVNRKPKA